MSDDWAGVSPNGSEGRRGNANECEWTEWDVAGGQQVRGSGSGRERRQADLPQRVSRQGAVIGGEGPQDRLAQGSRQVSSISFASHLQRRPFSAVRPNVCLEVEDGLTTQLSRPQTRRLRMHRFAACKAVNITHKM